MNAITTVISDFGGVLSGPLWEAFQSINERHGLEPTVLGAAMAAIGERDGENPLFEMECGRMTEQDFVTRLGEQVSADLGRHVDLLKFSTHFFEALPPNPPMLEEMAVLRDAGYRMGLLTNNVREWEPLWRAMFAVDELFEVVVDSAFVGVRKPGPAIYEITCERLGVIPSECVFVDDFEHNCEAAEKLGMATVWFRSTDQAIADLRSVITERGAPPYAARAENG
jgi:putative hydrolase of the HAD superfamily